LTWKLRLLLQLLLLLNPQHALVAAVHITWWAALRGIPSAVIFIIIPPSLLVHHACFSLELRVYLVFLDLPVLKLLNDDTSGRGTVGAPGRVCLLYTHHGCLAKNLRILVALLDRPWCDRARSERAWWKRAWCCRT